MRAKVEISYLSFFDRYRQTRQHQKFHALLAIGENLQAVTMFPNLELRNGPKQVSMAQFGNALIGLDRYEQAITAYEEAIESERNWGGRKKESHSQYLVAYCEFFANTARSRLGIVGFEDWLDRIIYLDCLPVSKRFKKYDLPVPNYQF